MATHPHAPITVDDKRFQLLERYTAILYDKTSELASVSEARRELFCRTEQWNIFHQLRMHFLIIQRVSPTKLESGLQVDRPNSRHQVQKDVDGHGMERIGPGALCGAHYLWHLNPAMN